MKRFHHWFAAILLACTVLDCAGAVTVAEHVVVYHDPAFYSAFPSIVQRPDGELLTAFRRAPERRLFGAKRVSHTDANSYLVMVRSKDDGKTWSKVPELIYAHPFGGSQDPCLLQLKDGTILCSSYAWAPHPAGGLSNLNLSKASDYAFLGGFLLRSRDGAKTWEPLIIPPPARPETRHDIFGQRVPAYNRGALCEGRDGNIYWAVAVAEASTNARTSVHLMISGDKGQSWKYSAPVALDAKVEFNEASVYETPSGALVVFLRTEGFNDQTCIARSTDGGKTFNWADAGFKGHPHHALQLPDKRVLLVYGYRHRPFGIRARILNAECTNAAETDEIVLREDGGNGDLGYPWATLINDETALVVYYFHEADATRKIEGTFLKLR